MFGQTDFLLSTPGLIYNGPALLFLGLLAWKRPIWGSLLAGLAFARVFIGWVPWSMHMMIATFGLLACQAKWMRALAALLFLFTTYYYLIRFENADEWLLGSAVGTHAATLAFLAGRLRNEYLPETRQ